MDDLVVQGNTDFLQFIPYWSYNERELDLLKRGGNYGEIYVTKPNFRDKKGYNAFKNFKGIGSYSYNEKKAFLEDVIALSNHIKPRHEFVVDLIAFSMSEHRMTIVTKYVSFSYGISRKHEIRDLHHYLIILRHTLEMKKGLHSSNRDTSDLLELNHRQLHKMAQNIASGMEYLHHKNIIHGDLMPQNILLDSKLNVKISDFAFINLKAYLIQNNVSLPHSHRWVAPEVILNSPFTKSTDVFSYGILLWAIGTLGGLPYDNISLDELYQKTVLGEVLVLPQIPKYFLPEFGNFLNTIWKERPTFSDIVQEFNSFPDGCYNSFDFITPEELPTKEVHPQYALLRGFLPMTPRWLTESEFLGDGNFGSVSAYSLGNHTLAVKKFKCFPTPEKIKIFFENIKLLKKALGHKNIVRSYNYYVINQTPHIVMEYVAFLSRDGLTIITLYEYLIHLRKEFNAQTKDPKRSPMLKRSPILNHEELGKFALEIASGMAYLEKVGIVHSILKSRNILLNDSKVIKISDYGLHGRGILRSKDDRAYFYYPRWASPELILNGTYSQKSDVWAYGIVLWEIATLGGLPYPNEFNDNNVIKDVLSKKTLEPWPNITIMLANLMEACWRFDASQRPSFQEVLNYLFRYETKKKAYLDFDRLPPTFTLPPAVKPKTPDTPESPQMQRSYFKDRWTKSKGSSKRPTESPPPPPVKKDENEFSLQSLLTRHEQTQKSEDDNSRATEQARLTGAIPRTPSSASFASPNVPVNPFRKDKEKDRSTESEMLPPLVMSSQTYNPQNLNVQRQDEEKEDLKSFMMNLILENVPSTDQNRERCKHCNRPLKLSEFCYCNVPILTGAVPRTPSSASCISPNVPVNPFRKNKKEDRSTESEMVPPLVTSSQTYNPQNLNVQRQDKEKEDLESFKMNLVLENVPSTDQNRERCKYCNRPLKLFEFCYCNVPKI